MELFSFSIFESHCEMNEVREEEKSEDGGGDLSGGILAKKTTN